MDDEYKAWTCGNGHVLGQVRRDGNRIRQLLVYRHAVDLSAEQPEEVEVLGYLEGTMMNIRCDVAGCGAVRTWEIAREAIEKAVATYLAE